MRVADVGLHSDVGCGEAWGHSHRQWRVNGFYHSE